MKNIGKAFRLLRIQKGWEQKEFAKKLNLSTPAVSKIETGFTTITLSRLNQIASVFNLTTVQLLAQHVLPQRNKGKVKEQDECAEILEKIRQREEEIMQIQMKIIQLYEELYKKDTV